MTSVELDYTENPALIVPSYTHQVRRTPGWLAAVGDSSNACSVPHANCKLQSACSYGYMSTHVL